MTLQLKRLLPTPLELFGSAFFSIVVVVLSNSKQLLSYYGLQSSNDLIKSNAGTATKHALTSVDSLSATDGVVTFLIWAAVGVLCFAIVEALGRAYKEIEFENELSSRKYIHPSTFTKAKFWQGVFFDFIAMAASLAFFAALGFLFVLFLMPLGLVYSRVFLFDPSIVNALYLLLGLAIIFVSLVVLNIAGRLLIFRRRLVSS